MKKLSVLSVGIILSVLLSGCKQEEAVMTPEYLEFVTERYSYLAEEADIADGIPRTVDQQGKLASTGIQGWTSGFFAGSLWYLYELTGDDRWENEAQKWTEALDTIQYLTSHHDVGFMINCSYGNGYRLTGNKAYTEVMVQAAKSLSERYSSRTKSIESWDYREAWDGTTLWNFPVIIDNMMNLELLFKASLLSGNKRFEEIAIQHAQTCMTNHYRDDFSSYHVVDYDTLTGAILDKATCQGLVDESSWARGQAWGLYGFVICFRYTGDEQYLEFAKNIANYITGYPDMPQDKIPYWDFFAADPSQIPEWDYDPSVFKEIPRDASAAAIISSALLELDSYVSPGEANYKEYATAILSSLVSSDYSDFEGKNKHFILNHSVGSIPHGVEIDVPLVYADYYLLEALQRLTTMTKP